MNNTLRFVLVVTVLSFGIIIFLESDRFENDNLIENEEDNSITFPFNPNIRFETTAAEIFIDCNGIKIGTTFDEFRHWQEPYNFTDFCLKVESDVDSRLGELQDVRT